MSEKRDFGAQTEFEVVRMRHGKLSRETQAVATEIPYTIVANGTEIATLLCSPINLLELACGYLFTSGFIKKASDMESYSCDSTRWIATVSLVRDPDPEILQKRLFTSGCGKGVVYANAAELASRHPVESDLTVTAEQIVEIAQWLQHCSELYQSTGAIHTAALSIDGAIPGVAMDDIGRHNAVDKIIGRALMDGLDFSRALVICSGRTSSEILHKAKHAGIPAVIARGAPTHQTILRARDMGVTVVGFARGGNFTVYSHEERIRLPRPDAGEEEA